MDKVWVYLIPIYDLDREDYAYKSGGIRGGEIGCMLQPGGGSGTVRFVFPYAETYENNFSWRGSWYGKMDEVVELIKERI